jgi:negative regulator of sigma E activity
MTTPQLDDERLQRYFDGELPEEEAEQIRRALEESDEAQSQLAQLGRLRDMMRMAAEDIPELSSEDLYERVRSGIEEDKQSGHGEGLQVIQGGGQARSSRPAPRRRGPMITGGVVAVAAAALLVVLRPWAGEDGPQGTPQPTADNQATKERDKAPERYAVVEETPQGSEVVEVDFGGNTGTVFNVEGGSGEPVAVVWINDEGGAQ